MTQSTAAAFARLPSIDRLLQDPALRDVRSAYGRDPVLEAVRAVVQDARDAITAGGSAPEIEELASRVLGRLDAQAHRGPRRVLNLSGTVIHTNLGRAPLPDEALDAMREAMGAVDLEFDLEAGNRGDRDDHVESLICALTGAEAATVVNNNAAAVLLVLSTFARGKDVAVSRGELVEIGGAFRVPEIMQRADARLLEVGTTNRTHVRDFEAASGPDTAMFMKVHPSNYEVRGFTHEVSIEEMVRVARPHGIRVAWDLGSGSLLDLSRLGLEREPLPADGLAAGADLVTFSGDKLLGGPQCGLIVGTREAIDAVRRNPLKRALRVDKLILAALAAVLRLWTEPEQRNARIPVLRLLTRRPEEIARLAQRCTGPIADALGPDWTVTTRSVSSQIGSGSLPVDSLPSTAIEIRPTEGSSGRVLDELAERLRGGPLPVVGRIANGALLLDARTLEDPEELIQQFARRFAEISQGATAPPASERNP